MATNNEIKHTLKDVQDILINVFNFDKSIQTLRNHIKKLGMPKQAAGKAIPTYSDEDVQKLAQHLNLQKQECEFQKLGNDKTIQTGLHAEIQKIHVHEFRQRKTNLKIDWLFDNATNSNIQQPQFNDSQLLEDLTKLDEFETTFDINNLEEQSKRIKLISQIEDYHTYVAEPKTKNINRLK